MICSNVKCNKEIAKPLELYNGEWACPHCREKISSSRTFRIDGENHEIYVLSECLYFRWMTMQGQEKINNGYLLDKAVEACRESAIKGHPQAIIRMGYYYDKDYVEVTSSEIMRCRAAYNYYSSVCFSDKMPEIIDKSVMSTFDWEYEQLRAGRLLLEMLSKLPHSETKHKKMDYNDNLNRLRNKFGEGKLGALEEIVFTHDTPGYERGYNTLKSCLSKLRAPVFGIFRVTGKEMKKIFDENKGFARRVASKIDVGYLECDAKGKVADELFFMLTNDHRITEVLANVSDTKTYLVYFFNENKGKHQYLNRKFREGVRKGLEKDDFFLVKRLCNDCGEIDFTFYDDDLYLYKTALNSPVQTVENLVNSVCEEE